MLVDSSVWIPFLRGDSTTEVSILSDALNGKQSVWIAPPILQEVLQGADSLERFSKWERVFGELPLLVEPDARAAAAAAAQLYARCRWKGITPRSTNDCSIALYAVSNNIPLLHCDRDFPLIATVEPKLTLLPQPQK
jgi:predicted nucleic acid-binding protein